MTTEDILQWLLIAAGLAGSAAAFILTRRDRQANTYSDLADTVTGLSREIRELRAELYDERERRQHLETGVYILINQLRKAGIEPEWTPNDH